MKRKIAIITLAMAMAFSAILTGCSNIPPTAPTPDPKPHLITAEQREQEPERPIDIMPTHAISMETGTNEDIDRQLTELAAAIQLGKKPELTNASTTVQKTYEAAITVLNNIILNDFSDYERVHAIYDYLAYYTEYDHALYDAYLAQEKINRYSPSFDARGVLLYEKAVCEGIAEAFVILCGIEGIRSVMITGEANDGESLINHAWNRVQLDDVWYNVDATFGSKEVSINDVTKKFLTHAYFLVDTESMTNHYEDAIRDAHEFENDEITILNVTTDLSYYDATEEYGYYAQELFGRIDGEDVYLQANSQAELDRIFKIVKESKTIGKIEIQITFAEGDALDAALRSAYVGVPLAHFAWDGGVIPLINNTFLCLIYL